MTGAVEFNQGADVLDESGKVRKASSWPKVGPTIAFYSCIPTGMHGPACIFWADLTPFSPQVTEANRFRGDRQSGIGYSIIGYKHGPFLAALVYPPTMTLFGVDWQTYRRRIL